MSQQQPAPLTAGNELPLDRCPHCGIGRPRISLVHATSTSPYGGGQRWWKVYQCSTCGGVVTAESLIENGPVRTIFPQGRTIDESIPDRARRHLREAMDTLSSPSASIVASASAVDAMLKARNYRDGSLYARIDQAAAAHLITSDMALWAHQVRLDANDQRHADEDAPFPEISDAQRCLDFAMALAEILFVLPSRVTRGIQASASSSSSSSSSPSASSSSSPSSSPSASASPSV